MENVLLSHSIIAVDAVPYVTSSLVFIAFVVLAYYGSSKFAMIPPLSGHKDCSWMSNVPYEELEGDTPKEKLSSYTFLFLVRKHRKWTLGQLVSKPLGLVDVRALVKSTMSGAFFHEYDEDHLWLEFNDTEGVAREVIKKLKDYLESQTTA